ncbi:phosphoglucomutase phosphomannomutase alpha beta alpha domain I [Apilactobacillus kunkeei DSM 12361 = ATCC 700308]|uniref:Phosphoglucomutase n=1 Tax=Apilactobacillus kunkeei DSM 12361 = ATCC 700308 TaxID=1423768 RepID=A0A0R1FQE8_9LACO|nr:phospho-sugar mutase [Apilactobacillus kunkeei]KOY72798.1 putative phosphoglucomutase [Apilactobacillus kunkeei DSM 12361 = ATCC 700308]KRK22547.1 phosphoglucomutase phosphomannomutase alpha beta alpha domain I [Apilactobacillus kunkeei DSM 12361 = ATCC 700308]QYU52866.1 phospho-sugar mutase [Apilactobacillus kunkeei]
MNAQDLYQKWVDQPNLNESVRHDLAKIANNNEEINDAFGTNMSFGTAGMRGLIGAGINRMNIYTVRQATEGLASYMDTLDEEAKKRGVAISFDSRYHSKEFAYEAARVLGQHNIKSYVFDDIRPTPELSFAIRHLRTFAGVMITASHNPMQYNGYKIYGQDGGQMPPKASDMITDYVRKADDVFAINVADVKDLRDKNLLSVVGEDVDDAYLANVKTVNVNHDLIREIGKELKFVYTPLHGTGKIICRRALDNVGFKNYSLVKEQAIADPEFPTVDFPNPEFPEAFNYAIKLGNEENADVLIATDPDADRLGAAVRQPDGSYELMTGNQIASVLLDYILTAKKNANDLPADGTVVKSIVSTELATKIANNYGVEMQNVLTGFKYIAEKIKDFEENKNHTFLFGFEESFGYLIKPFVRDKDAIQSTVLLAEVAAYYKQKGQTLYDGLQSIYKKYGYHEEKTISKTFSGIEGKEKMANIMNELRSNPLNEFNNQKVESLEDFQTSTKTNSDGSTETIELPEANVLKYWLDDGTWFAIRPSGTEPKIKFYLGTVDDSAEAVNNKLKTYEDAVDQLIEQLV